MNKYIYAECPVDTWPTIKSLMAASYSDATEKLISNYAEYFDDEGIYKCNDFVELRDYLNNMYTLALSDLEIYEEL